MTWTGISAPQHDEHPHTGVTGWVAGGQGAIANLSGGTLPLTGTIVLLTDLVTSQTALRDATQTRLAALESKVNAMLAMHRASGQIVT